MTAIFIIPNNTTRFIVINLLSTSPDTIIISKLTTISRMEYLSHTLRYCSIFFRTNISPAITAPTMIIIAITRKHHDHSVEKYSFSPQIFNSDGRITHSTYLHKTLTGTFIQAIRASHIGKLFTSLILPQHIFDTVSHCSMRICPLINCLIDCHIFSLSFR